MRTMTRPKSNRRAGKRESGKAGRPGLWMMNWFILGVILSAPAWAGAPQEARLATAADFMAGDFNGTQASGEGLSIGVVARSFGPVKEAALTSMMVDGDRVIIGTGPEGRVYAWEKGALSLLAETHAQRVTALAMHKGRLYIGTSSPASVHMLEGGKAVKVWSGEEAYLNALQVWKDRLYFAVGNPARLYRLENGKAQLILSVGQEAFTALAVDGAQNLWAGTSGNGWIIRLRDESAWSVMHRDDLPQIGALVAGGTGRMYFLSGNYPKESKDVPGTSSALGVVDAERVTILKKWDNVLMTAMGWNAQSKRLTWGGNEGKLYTLNQDKIALYAQVPQQQIAAVAGDWVATQAACDLFRLEPAREGEYTSKPFDAKRAARWGELTWKGSGGVKAAVRFGNQEKPDASWTPFSTPCADTPCAAAGSGRYGQVKLVLAPDARVEAVSWVYKTMNAPPEIRSFNVLEPGEVFLKTGYSPDNVMIEAVNPDRYGMFTTVSAPPAEARDQDKGKKYYMRGYRTFTWEVADADGDEVQSTLEFKKEGWSGWMPVFEKEKAAFFAFDTQALPDGAYRFRLTAADVPEGERAQEISPIIIVDNTPPQVSSKAAGGDLLIEVSDALSRLWKVEWSADGKPFKALQPEDGILDGPREKFRLGAAELKGKTFIVVRAVDSFYNAVTVPVNLPH